MRKFFININKSGGAIVENALQLPHQHATAREFIAEFGRDEWEGGFKFAFVRNPWDRALAIYKFRNTKNPETRNIAAVEFSDWLKRVFIEKDPQHYSNPKMFMPQSDWLVDEEGAININHIARFENIEDEFKNLCVAFGISVELPPLQSSNRPDYRPVYDSTSIEVVRQWFATDIENFGYSFD